MMMTTTAVAVAVATTADEYDFYQHVLLSENGKSKKSITVAAIRQQQQSKLPKGAITTTSTGEGNLADCDIQAVAITSQPVQQQNVVVVAHTGPANTTTTTTTTTASATKNINNDQNSQRSSVDHRAMQRCGLCSILSNLLRRAMCIGSRRGSGESYYQELAETNQNVVVVAHTGPANTTTTTTTTTASATKNINNDQNSQRSSVDHRAMQRCGLCSILSNLLRRAMCIGSRRGSGESYYQELAETNFT
uniref:CSON012076 protein n=1 Tax=Culicoides sonorensis TaxID=179676 RepID=A0A336KLN5_CULSO